MKIKKRKKRSYSHAWSWDCMYLETVWIEKSICVKDVIEVDTSAESARENLDFYKERSMILMPRNLKGVWTYTSQSCMNWEEDGNDSAA